MPPPAAKRAAARGGWESEPSFIKAQAAQAAAQAAAERGPRRNAFASLPGRGRSHSPAVEVEPAVLSSSSYANSAGSLVPSSSAAAKPPPANVDIFWHSSYEPSTPEAAAEKVKAAARAHAKQKRGKGGDALLPRAPAFGQGALTKWH
jgi:hypothetical protein